jgi:uncharacterized protein involved in exopolysaccharide biosynthesis
MIEGNVNARADQGTYSLKLRDSLAISFRQRGLIITTFLGIFFAGVLIALLLPAQYESQMKLLVKRERADALVSPDREPTLNLHAEVTEEELESEAELLKSRDLLTKVVIACDLDKLEGSSFWNTIRGKVMASGKGGDLQDERRIGRATLALEKHLVIEPIKRTNLIGVTYRAHDPQLAVRVVNTIASLYLDKHLAMHRVPGAFDFFNQQAEEYRKGLAIVEARLTDFSRNEGVVSPPLEKEIAVRKLTEFQAEAQEARASMAETRQRIRTLEAQLASLPRRETTQVRTADNPQLMERFKSTLLDLELKRTQLLTKFDPSYRPVQELDTQITQARQAIEAAEKAPLRDEVTDRDPTYEALRAELAKSQTELATLQARVTAMGGLARTFQAESERLDQKEILQNDLLRAAKAQEENYLLYLHKEEEARISDALDRQRISNVVVAEAATVPFAPRSRRLVLVVLAGLFASVASVMVGFAADRWDPSFRTPEEVRSLMGCQVLAAIPKNG